MAGFQTSSVLKPSVVFENFDQGVKFSDFEEIGHFSVDDDEQYHGDQSQLRYLVLPETMHGLKWDLNVGFDEASRDGLQDARRFDHLLRWILQNQNVKKELESPEKCTFVCYWGVIRAVLQTTAKISDWQILATRYKGAIYLTRMSSEAFVELCSSEEGERRFYWSRKFLQYMTTGELNGNPHVRSSAGKSERYNAVLHRKFGEHQLLYSAAVDALDLNRSPEEGQYTFITLCNDFIGNSKLARMHIECKKLGLKEVLCGFFDRAGIVRKLEYLKTDEISRRLKEEFYNEERTLSYLDNFLRNVKRVMTEDHPKVMYKFCYDPRRTTSCDGNYLMYERVKYDSKSFVLPEWYISEFETTFE